MKSVSVWMCAAVVTCLAPSLAQAKNKAVKVENPTPVVVISTSMGDISVQLDREKAPGTVKNFLQYVDEKFYDGTLFHRVISSFMIQGGGFTPDMKEKPTHEAIKNESANGLKNERGTIAMARLPDPDSATAQFFINVVDNPNLNNGGPFGGYAVFGKVIDGLDVVDKIRAVPTHMQNGMGDVPTDQVIIKSIRVKK